MFRFFRKIYNLFIIARLIYKHGIENLLRDPLTGAYNRMALEEFGEREIKRAKRYKRHLYCAMVDVNGLKIINDGEGGHLAGDEALKIVVTVLKKNCRETDSVIRFGGDEFIVLMSETTKLAVNQFFKRVVEGLRGFSLSGFSLSVSMGSYFWKKGMTLNQLIKKADDNLYIQKKSKKKKPDAI